VEACLSRILIKELIECNNVALTCWDTDLRNIVEEFTRKKFHKTKRGGHAGISVGASGIFFLVEGGVSNSD